MTSAQVIHRLLPLVKAQFALEWPTVHGIDHWVRVWRNARELCEVYDEDWTVPLCFAFLHDSCRESDRKDPAHGPRAADFIERLYRAGKLNIMASEFHLLSCAVWGHTGGTTAPNRIVQICWDADRLDYGRVGRRPDPAQLFTDHARKPEVIEAAFRRSHGYEVQELLRQLYVEAAAA